MTTEAPRCCAPAPPGVLGRVHCDRPARWALHVRLWAPPYMYGSFLEPDREAIPPALITSPYLVMCDDHHGDEEAARRVLDEPEVRDSIVDAFKRTARRAPPWWPSLRLAWAESFRDGRTEAA